MFFFVQEDPACSELVSNAMACQMVSANLAPTAIQGTHVHTIIDSGACRPRKAIAGVIFCVGGRGTTGDPFRSIEVYNWRENRWFSVAEMATKRRHVGVVSACGKVLANFISILAKFS